MAIAEGWIDNIVQSVSAPFSALNDGIIHNKTSPIEDAGSESTAPHETRFCPSSSSSSGLSMADADERSDQDPYDYVQSNLQQREIPVISSVQKTLVRSISLDQLRSDPETKKMTSMSGTSRRMSEPNAVKDQRALKMAFRESVQNRREAARHWVEERVEPKQSGSFQAPRQKCAPGEIEEIIANKKITGKKACFPTKIFSFF